MQRQWHFIAMVALLLGGFSGTAHAVGIAHFQFGAPNVQPGQASIDVTLQFTSDNALDEVNALALSVFDSDLTAGNSDFSRFSFTRDTAIADWLSLGDSLGVDGVETWFAVPPFDGTPLNPGTFTLGEILIDLSGLTPGSSYQITLAGGELLNATNTDAGGIVTDGQLAEFVFSFAADENPDIAFVTFGTDAQVTVPQTSTVIPEPATATMAVMALMGAAWFRRRA